MPDNEINATEAAAEFAKQNGIDLAQVTGTGQGGRIGMPDVQAFMSENEESSEESDGADADTQESESDGGDDADTQDDADAGDSGEESNDEPSEGAPVVKKGTALMKFRHNEHNCNVGDVFEGSKEDAKELRKKGLIK